MKLIIDIPTEFETDYKGDKFKDFFSRVLCDIEKGVLCGRYEKETAEKFLKAFDESVPMANIVEKLEDELLTSQSAHTEAVIGMCGVSASGYSGEISAYTKAINIVKQEINNGENNT